MMLRAAEGRKLALDDGAARVAKRTYHVGPNAGDTWHHP